MSIIDKMISDAPGGHGYSNRVKFSVGSTNKKQDRASLLTICSKGHLNQKEMMDKNDFVWQRERQVQSLLGLKRTTLYKMRMANLIRWSKIGNTVYYDMVSIEDYLELNSSKFSSPKNKLV